MLPQHSASHQGVYVKFTDLDPFDSIRQALKEQIRFSAEAIVPTGLTALLEKAGQVRNKTLVLFFDQFEQFFVHHPRQKQRQPFIAALAQWYKNGRNVPAKILFSLRSDFYYRMDELQKTMGYSLGPQDAFELQKFTPSQATAIFQVIAEVADLNFDRSFVEEMTKQELAQRDDGLISPVDMQILAWVIHGQKTETKGGFNKTAFQKMGGIEGLLENLVVSMAKMGKWQEARTTARSNVTNADKAKA